jgi:hypothetical protein
VVHRSEARERFSVVVGAAAFLAFVTSAALSPETRRVDLFFAFIALIYLWREWRTRRAVMPV